MTIPTFSNETIDDIIAQMDRMIERCRDERSKLGYFAVLYRNVTRRVRDAIAAGRFEDGPRMERLDVVFAHRYLDALDCFWRGETPTQCWLRAFQAIRSWRPIIMQHLLLGMNAHINLDLAIAAVQVAPGNQLPGLEHDFKEITLLLDDMIQDMEQRIEQCSPWFRIIDYVGGRTNAQICGFAMQQARDLAWLAAQELARTTPEQLAQQIELHDQIVAGLANVIQAPIGIGLNAGLLLIGLREWRNVPDVMRVLEM